MTRLQPLVGLVLILGVAYALSTNRKAIKLRTIAWGLGLQFLRHIERTRLLAFVIPIESEDWQAEFDQLRNEIRSYSEALAEKPYCVVFSKLDLLGESYVPEIEAPGAFGKFAISAPGRMGLDDLLDAWWRQLLAMRAASEKSLQDAQQLP